jgi:hypothetical protein
MPVQSNNDLKLSWDKHHMIIAGGLVIDSADAFGHENLEGL